MNKQEAFKHLRKTAMKMKESAEENRKEAQKEANHHGGAMESRYDTFKEEAQYLAGAQQKRCYELNAAFNQLSAIISNHALLEISHQKVSITSIVTISDENNQQSHYLISPVLGGGSLYVNEMNVTVLNSSSPIGKQMMGKSVGDELFVAINGKEKEFFIESIQ